MYTKNLEQLLRLLRSSRQSGLLTVEPADQESAFWQGQFRLAEGHMVSCLIWRKIDGQIVLRDDEAIRWLSTQGKLNWSLREDVQFSEKLLPALPPHRTLSEDEKKATGEQAVVRVPVGWIPRRTAKGARLSIQMLKSMEHRQIFALVNGYNTIEGISRLLHKSSDIIDRVLSDFRNADLIE